MKSVCMFCMRSHKRLPKLCEAKGDILNAYMKAGPLQAWQVMAGVEQGFIKLEAEALELVQKRKKKKRAA